MTEKKVDRKCFRVFCTAEKEEMARMLKQTVDDRMTRSSEDEACRADGASRQGV